MYHLKGFGLVPVVCLVLASCGGSGSGSETAASNLEPVVTGDQTIAVLEGVQLTNAYSASDPEDGTVTLSLAGTDASVMTLSAAGDLTFNTVPDFEAPLDSDTDNVYNVSVVASDSVNETSYELLFSFKIDNQRMASYMSVSIGDAIALAPISPRRLKYSAYSAFAMIGACPAAS